MILHEMTLFVNSVLEINTMLSQSDIRNPLSLRGSTPNNCSAVYQDLLVPLLIQASPHPLLIALRNLRRGLT